MSWELSNHKADLASARENRALAQARAQKYWNEVPHYAHFAEMEVTYWELMIEELERIINEYQ